MPAQRPRASFEPIAPDFNLKALVEATPNFQYVDRISYEMIEQQGMTAFEKLVLLHVIAGGKPLVIDGFEERLDPWTFTPKWLRDNCGDRVENARNLTTQENLPLTMGHYLKNMGLLTNQFFDKPGAYKEKGRQRVYLKDIDCPPVWWDKLKEHLPAALSYLNDSTGDIGGPGAKPDPTSTIPGRRLGKGIARAGDLMSSLPPDMRAENLMCYIGHEGTYTPTHREMCASLGQNIMVEASCTVSDDGKAEKPGSSIWFMTESKDRQTVSEYFLSVLGHDIEVENHFAQVVAWKKAPFSVYVVEQRPGDLILIPPLAPHQVWNRGTRTMKVAWNRTTVETLEMALNEALPRSRIVCRDEQYKNKAIIYYTLQKYSSLLLDAQRQTVIMPRDAAHSFLYSGKIKYLIKDFKRLFVLYKQILLSEMFSLEDSPKTLEYLPFDGNVTCAYCRSNIFNRFLTCPCCKDMLGHYADTEDGDPYDVCMDCYAIGRSCYCISGLKWVEQFKWKELVGKYETWRKMIIELDGSQVTDKTPVPLLEERRRYGKKTLAEVCKDQLKRRPFKDPHKPDEKKEDEESEQEIVVDDNGKVKKVTRKKSKAWLKNNKPCHICCHRHPTWKMAQCTTCERAWCYGSLFRGWDKMPLEIMENPDWSCPHCLGICFAGACKREGKMQPYEPKGTLLGHDTKKVADVRSIETLVDFSVSNLNWLKEDEYSNAIESRRMRRARDAADREKENDPDLSDEGVDGTRVGMEYSPVDGLLDPALRDGLGGLDDEATLARKLQLANASLPGPAGMVAGAPVNSGVPYGYAPLAATSYDGYAPQASMYPNPHSDETYQYPSQDSNEHELLGTSNIGKGKGKKRKLGRKDSVDEDEDEDEDMTMSKAPKQKKPRLQAAGFRSHDLAEEATGASASKAKNEAQRQFEKEKERKALDKAKAEGRFIMLQAAIKGKKRIVRLPIPSNRLAQVIAQQAAKATFATTSGSKIDAQHEIDDSGQEEEQPENNGLLLKSDIAPKKDLISVREQRIRDGIIVHGGTKTALVPVEKDDNYGYTYRERLPSGSRARRDRNRHQPTLASNKERRKSQKQATMYEEVDIGSDEGDFEEENSFVPINSSAGRNRRSLPGYLQGRHEDNDHEVPSTDFQDRSHKQRAYRSRKRQSVSGPDLQLQQETEDAIERESGDEDIATVPTDTIIGAANSGLSNGSTSHSWAKPQGGPSKSKEAEGETRKAAEQANQQANQRQAEANRVAKLQALQMLEGGDMMDFHAIDSNRAGGGIDNGFEEVESDDSTDEIPARRISKPISEHE